MNIFVVDRDPYIAASSLCNAHVIKMIVESCQLLSTHDRIDLGLDSGNRYAPTHYNHPCRRCLVNENNYNWLRHHLYGLLNEYKLRYYKDHSCKSLFDECWNYGIDSRYWDNPYTFVDANKDLVFNTSFPKCMPEEYWVGSQKEDHIDNVVQSYINYYRFKKTSIARFTYKERSMPAWLQN